MKLILGSMKNINSTSGISCNIVIKLLNDTA